MQAYTYSSLETPARSHFYFRATRGRTYLMLTWAHQDQRSSAGL